MKNKKYLIPEISALSIISTARKTDDGYDFCFDSTSIPNEYRTNNTFQDDCPIFHQAMCILYGEDFCNSSILPTGIRLNIPEKSTYTKTSQRASHRSSLLQKSSP